MSCTKMPESESSCNIVRSRVAIERDLVRYAVVEAIAVRRRSRQLVAEHVTFVAVAEGEPGLERVPARDVRACRARDWSSEPRSRGLRIARAGVHRAVDEIAERLLRHRNHRRIARSGRHVRPWSWWRWTKAPSISRRLVSGTVQSPMRLRCLWVVRYSAASGAVVALIPSVQPQ